MLRLWKLSDMVIRGFVKCGGMKKSKSEGNLVDDIFIYKVYINLLYCY